MKQLLIIAAACLVLCACDKDKKNDTAPLTKTDAQWIAANESLIFDSFNSANGTASSQSVTGSPSAVKMALTCATLSVNALSYPKTVTIQYATGGCLENGALRQGKLTITLSAPWWQTGAELTFAPQDYYVNGIKIEGTQTYKNNGLTANGLSYTVKVVNGRLTVGTYSQTWNCERTVTINSVNQQYTMTGSGSGVTFTGVSYALDITSTLIRKFDCAYVGKGTVKITHNGQESTLDYGDGTCDAEATITSGGNTYTVNMDGAE